MLNTNLMIKKVAVENKTLYMLKNEDIYNVQQLLLKVLDDIHFVCEKYGLAYSLCGGSALGAVRHQGFVPWDDDLDICMPRKDYNNFREFFLKEFHEKYWVQNVQAYRKFDLNFMKIRVKNTRFLEITDPQPELAGCFVDIFPLENIYENKLLQVLQGSIASGLLFITSCLRIRKKYKQLYKLAYDTPKLKRALTVKKIAGFWFSFLPLSVWLRLTENSLKMCKDEHSKYVGIPTGRGHFFGEIYERDKMFPFKQIDFQGRKAYIFCYPELYLKALYGDYMRIPPVEERERHCILEYEIEGHEKNR